MLLRALTVLRVDSQRPVRAAAQGTLPWPKIVPRWEAKPGHELRAPNSQMVLRALQPLGLSPVEGQD